MTHTRRSLTCRQSQLFRSLIATAFIANGFFPFVAPALAEGTKAGQTISNTATATYNDPNNSGTTLNTTSNPVVVTVAEVAGITISNVGVVDSTPADVIKVGDTLTYTFAIKNVGNDPTRFRIPNLATTTGPVVAGNLSYSINGSYTQIPGTEVITSSIPVGGTVLVQVPVTVQAGANANDAINVKIGDTPNNAQNVLRVNNGGDVYTVDNPDAPTIIDEIPGVPINGTREASNTQISTVGSTPATNNMSLATLLKTNTYSNNNTTNSITDDTITYNLSLRVEGSDVTGLGITPQPLTGFSMTVTGLNNNVASNYILVSDVIPAGTVLSAVPTNVPTGWTAVYSTAVATNVKPTDAAAAWTTTAPALGSVTRVGFVRDTTATSDIPAGTTVTGFAIPLAITGTPTTLTINSIAQLVGQTPGAGGLPVYDESGDQNPSNYSGPAGNMTPGAASTNGILPTDAAAVLANIIDGVANPITQGIDTNNNNTGTGPGGEDNQLIISVVTTTTGVLNGPEGKANATGPDGTNNTDFTNKSSLIPAGTNPGSTIDPAPVAFTNTVQNTSGATNDVKLAPTVPANPLDLPTGTKVTITYDNVSAVYTYDKTGSGSFTIAAGGAPISIPGVPATGAASTVNYGVEVDLPAGTKLSTDTLPDYTGDTEWGYPVPITATIGTGNTAKSNITIDRVYTGFLQLLKFSKILKGTGPDVIGNQGNFNSTPAYTNTGIVIDPDPATGDEARTPSPGNIIQYEIRYKNISTSQGTGTGNVILNAQNVVITEDGTLSTVPGDGKNNWAKDNDGDGIIDTSNVIGTATAITTTFTPNGDISGATPATDVTKYVNSPTTSIAPQTSGTFTFQRKLN